MTIYACSATKQRYQITAVWESDLGYHSSIVTTVDDGEMGERLADSLGEFSAVLWPSCWWGLGLTPDTADALVAHLDDAVEVDVTDGVAGNLAYAVERVRNTLDPSLDRVPYRTYPRLPQAVWASVRDELRREVAAVRAALDGDDSDDRALQAGAIGQLAHFSRAADQPAERLVPGGFQIELAGVDATLANRAALRDTMRALHESACGLAALHPEWDLSIHPMFGMLQVVFPDDTAMFADKSNEGLGVVVRLHVPRPWHSDVFPDPDGVAEDDELPIDAMFLDIVLVENDRVVNGYRWHLADGTPFEAAMRFVHDRLCRRLFRGDRDCFLFEEEDDEPVKAERVDLYLDMAEVIWIPRTVQQAGPRVRFTCD